MSWFSFVGRPYPLSLCFLDVLEKVLNDRRLDRGKNRGGKESKTSSKVWDPLELTHRTGDPRPSPGGHLESFGRPRVSEDPFRDRYYGVRVFGVEVSATGVYIDGRTQCLRAKVPVSGVPEGGRDDNGRRILPTVNPGRRDRARWGGSLRRLEGGEPSAQLREPTAVVDGAGNVYGIGPPPNIVGRR